MAPLLAHPPTQIHQNIPSGTKGRQFNPVVNLASLLRLWHLSSLDAPTVAVTWSLGFARAAKVSLPAWVPILLALGTWAVYVGDRLLDAGSALRSGNLSHLRERHYFHWTHRRTLAPLAVFATAVSAAIIFFLMPIGMQERNSVLAAASLAYFSGIHVPPRLQARLPSLFSKELFVGVLFTAGCAFPTLSRLPVATSVPRAPLLATLAFFALLAWLNCYVIDRWEGAAPAAVTTNALVLGMLGLILAFRLSLATAQNASGLLLLGSISALVLALLGMFRSRVSPIALRAAADLALLTPLIYLAR